MFKQNISFEVWGGESGKYRLRDNDKNPLENSPEETCSRVAKTLSDLETNNKDFWYKEFMSILGNKFAGGGRIMANAGAGIYKKETSPINCTVMRQIPDSMAGIMDIAKDAALTLKSGCGVGYDFSTIRPKGSHVFGAGADTSGVISFMKIFDSICSTIMSGGARRGAQMGCLDISSPEIEDFITEKRKDGQLRYFNCSILISDAFMQSVVDDKDWDLWFWEKSKDKPDVKDICLIKLNDIPYNHSNFNYFQYDSLHNEVTYGNCATTDIFKKRIYKTVKAKYLFDLVVDSTYNFWEPGFLLIDRVNLENNLYFCETIRCSNPCVTGDTRLATQFGLVTVKELYDNQSELNVTVDNRTLEKNLGTSIRPAVPVFMTSDNAQVYKITTDHGYEIKATEWHKFPTPKGDLKLKDLSVGDTLFLQSGKGQFGNKGSRELGEIIGMITGDGNISNDGKYISAYLSFWGDDIDLAPHFLKNVNAITSLVKRATNRIYSSKIVTVKSKNMVRIKSKLLASYLDENFNFNSDTKLRVPEVIWQGTEDCVSGYLSALFQADGTINIVSHKSHCRVALSSSHLDLLKDVQVLLSNYGIISKIVLRRKSQLKMMPDGKGGHKEYFCKDNYELFISKESVLLFQKYIGFMGEGKNNRLNKWIKNHKFYKDDYETTIKSIELLDNEPVYDTTQADKHGIIFNGISTLNCGEQPLSPSTSCLLGSMILPTYVNNAFEKEVSFDFESFKKDIKIASRLLDNVVEINNLPLKEMQDEILNKRRHGLGFTGLGSLFNMMNMPYGSKESLDLLDKISFLLAKESLLENISLAKEKGCAPIFNIKESRKLVLKSKYLTRLIDSLDNKEDIAKDILEYGLRYSHATSIAPTGTLSLTWGNNCSNGIEPVFANSYLRNIRDPNFKTKVQEEVSDYAFFLWKEKFGDEKLPSHWRTTDDLNVMDHLMTQSIAQKWCDSAISKTINVPSDYPFDKFKDVYLDGWKLGLKGVTTYRPNASVSSGVLTQKHDLDNTQYTFYLEDGEEVSFKGSDFIEYDGETHNVANLFDALKEGIYGKM